MQRFVTAAGLMALAEALTLADTTGERWYESEIYRLKGELLLQQHTDNQAESEHCFQQAISIARSQQAKSWELRASTSLTRLWHQCIIGSPKDSTLRICRKRKRCWMS